jgi:hypothetical protein
MHGPGGLALGGQVQGERPDQRLERARVQLPGLPGQPGAPPQHGHSFPLLRPVFGPLPARRQPFRGLTVPYGCGPMPIVALAFLRVRRQGRLSFGRCSHGARDDHPPDCNSRQAEEIPALADYRAAPAT